jgi:hypothetical protein
MGGIIVIYNSVRELKSDTYIHKYTQIYLQFIYAYLMIALFNVYISP